MPTELDDLKKQVEDLQSQLAFQEDTIAGLDTALGQQQQEILLLRRQVELLHQRLKEQAEGAAQNNADVADEKPPHY